jgi:hypothetical protein
MRLEEQLPSEIRVGLITSDNTFELAALQHVWDDIKQEDYS